MDEKEDEEEEDDVDVEGSEEDECGVATSMTSLDVPGEDEGKRKSMSPCL